MAASSRTIPPERPIQWDFCGVTRAGGAPPGDAGAVPEDGGALADGEGAAAFPLDTGAGAGEAVASVVGPAGGASVPGPDGVIDVSVPSGTRKPTRGRIGVRY